MKTLMFALALLFVAGCTDTKDHYLTCTEYNNCPGHSTCQDGVCVEEAGTCSNDSECPRYGTCREGLCYASDACYLDLHDFTPQNAWPVEPGPSVNLLSCAVWSHGLNVPGCAPEVLAMTITILVTTPGPEEFVPQLEMWVDGAKVNSFWVTGSDLPVSGSGWHRYDYAWAGNLSPKPLGVNGLSGMALNCVNCDVGMPAGVNIFTEVTSYTYRITPTNDKFQWRYDAHPGIDQLTTFP